MVDAAARTERALDLLRQSARVSPPLREAVDRVESELRRAREVASDAWQSYEEADREASEQMAAKLEAQMALQAITQALCLEFSSLGNGWREATPKILTRIETVVDEADRGFRERDHAKATNVDAHRQHLVGMHLVWQMAKYGPGPDTSPETTLATIAAFAEKRIRSIEEQLPQGYYEEADHGSDA